MSNSNQTHTDGCNCCRQSPGGVDAANRKILDAVTESALDELIVNDSEFMELFTQIKFSLGYNVSDQLYSTVYKMLWSEREAAFRLGWSVRSIL